MSKVPKKKEKKNVKLVNCDVLRSERFQISELIKANHVFLNDCYYSQSERKLKRILEKSSKREKTSLQRLFDFCISQKCGIKFSSARSKRIKSLENYDKLIGIYQSKVSCEDFAKFLMTHQQFIPAFLGHFTDVDDDDDEYELSSCSDSSENGPMGDEELTEEFLDRQQSYKSDAVGSDLPPSSPSPPPEAAADSNQ